jgi:prepilin-type N-terminal cleavage/methylation domain-containing protein
MRRGFSLVELLIAMILTVILLSTVALIFFHSTETVTTSEARIHVYEQARLALDVLERDLQSCFPFTGGQRFVLENGFNTGPNTIQYASTGLADTHYGKAADRLILRATAVTGDTIQPVEVTYELKPYNDPTRTKGARTGRPMFVLVRSSRCNTIQNPEVYDVIPKDSTGAEVNDQELCHFVLSFNIEYYASNSKFSQLDPSPCPPSDPLGDMDLGGQGKKNDTAEAIRMRFIRVTMSIVDDTGERQERMVTRVIWIPLG